jgi:lysophospholipase L1-like esterase
MLPLAAKLALSPLLVAQALLARKRVPRLPEAAGPRSGAVGRGPALNLLVVGDSSAAGVGVQRQSQALAAPLAAQLAEATGTRVHWRLLAQSGLTTAQVLQMLADQPPMHADVAVVVTGVNDVVDQVPSQRAVAARDALANRLRNAAGVHHVVFAPLPPVHQFPGLPRPLRWVAGADARRHDRALAEWAATRADVSHVDFGVQLNRGVMAEDGFHPGAPVYRQCASMLARHIATAVWPTLHGGTT